MAAAAALIGQFRRYWWHTSRRLDRNFTGMTDATGIPTSSGRAQGAWQSVPQTAKEYGLSDPTDFNAATPAAMHKLADLAQKNGGDWEKAVEQYGTFSTGQGAAADAAVRQKFRDYMGNQTPVAQDVAQGTGRGLIQGAGYAAAGMPAGMGRKAHARPRPVSVCAGQRALLSWGLSLQRMRKSFVNQRLELTKLSHQPLVQRTLTRTLCDWRKWAVQMYLHQSRALVRRRRM